MSTYRSLIAPQVEGEGEYKTCCFVDHPGLPSTRALHDGDGIIVVVKFAGIIGVGKFAGIIVVKFARLQGQAIRSRLHSGNDFDKEFMAIRDIRRAPCLAYG